MKRGAKLIVISVILLVSNVKIKAQSSANAFASATIVTPLMVTSEGYQGFETIANKTSFSDNFLLKNNVPGVNNAFINILSVKNTVTAADFTINGGIGDVYTITLPGSVLLVNTNGIEKMTANLVTENLPQQGALNLGKQRIKVDAGLYVDNGQLPGRYSSQAFDVTVNFN